MSSATRRQPLPPSAASELLGWWRSELRDWLGGIFGGKTSVRESPPADIVVVRDGLLLGRRKAGPHDVADLRDRSIDAGGGKLPRTVIVMLAEGRFLRRKLADQRIPLVRAQKMAELDVETQTPFKLDDVYVVFAKSAALDGGTYYYLIRRSVLDPVLDALRDGRRRLGGLVFEEGGNSKSAGSYVLAGLGGRDSLFSTARKHAFGIGCIILVAVTGYNVSAALADALKVADRTIEGIEPKAKAARQAFKERAAKLERIEAVRAVQKSYVPVVRLLEELSLVLPDTTYLTSVSLRQGRIKVTGFSDNAAALISLVDSSTFFVNPRFVSAVVKAPDRNGDQFDLEVEIEHAG